MMIWFFLGFFLQLGAASSDEYAFIDPPLLIAGDQLIETADEKLKLFERELEWFFAYRKPHPLEIDDDPFTPEKNQQQLDDYQELCHSILDAQKEFLNVRKKIAYCALLEVGNNHAGYLNHAQTILDTTMWYIDTMRKTLFPDGWKSHYELYLKEKEKQLLLNRK